MDSVKIAPGIPGWEPRWTSSAKDGVGTAPTPTSRIWFTLKNGIVTEVYAPLIDRANTRILHYLVSNGKDFFATEEEGCLHETSYIAIGVPAYKIVNTCKQGRFRITKIIITDPNPFRDVLLIRTRFEVLKGNIEDYHLYAYVNPHINNAGKGNLGWVSEYKGFPMLFAKRDDFFLALAASIPFAKMSVGFVGVSDGWGEIAEKKQLLATYQMAENGNVGLIGEIDLKKSEGEFTLAMALSFRAMGAGQNLKASLVSNFDLLLQQYVNGWKEIQHKFSDLGKEDPLSLEFYRTSIMVLKTHETKMYTGAAIASLSIPWGFAKGDFDLGGYHLIWPRDLVETAGGFLAAGDAKSAREVLFYLECTQEADGHWAQCLWSDGDPYWVGIQMDETAMPILLADTLKRQNGLEDYDPWKMVKKAAEFIVKNGPVTQEDRWEEDGGFTPFTLAAEIAALLAAAEFFDENGQSDDAMYLRETADHWNSCIELWTYVTNTQLAKKVGVEGYYVRVTPPEVADASSPTFGFVPIKNRPPKDSQVEAETLVSTDALALVRFGLRSATDPRILNTVKVIDYLLKTNTKSGPTWHRYNGDGYGEHRDGSPFNGTGKGRGWPLLVGERAHYELAAGNHEEAKKLLKIMQNQANSMHLIPEQVWDGPDIPEKGLFNGKPSGSAMPLVWAHAEYIKLVRSLKDRAVFDLPEWTKHRYLMQKQLTSPFACWRYNHKLTKMKEGKKLRIELLAPARIHWSTDEWKTSKDVETKTTGLGIHYYDLPVQDLEADKEVYFTFFWPQSQKWEGTNFKIKIVPSKKLARIAS